MAKKSVNNNHKGSEDYSAEDITVMEGLEAVRKRPGMYIGTTGLEGVQHLIHELLIMEWTKLWQDLLQRLQ